MKTYRIDHYRVRVVDGQVARVRAPRLAAQDTAAALAQFDRYCSRKLRSTDVASLIDPNGALIASRAGDRGEPDSPWASDRGRLTGRA